MVHTGSSRWFVKAAEAAGIIISEFAKKNAEIESSMHHWRERAKLAEEKAPPDVEEF